MTFDKLDSNEKRKSLFEETQDTELGPQFCQTFDKAFFPSLHTKTIRTPRIGRSSEEADLLIKARQSF
jgi:hypothetical protein